MYVVLTLDTELAWGRLSKDKDISLAEDPSSGRDAIEFILETFENHNIPVTWAVVGHLLLESCSRDSHYRADYIDEIDPYSDRDDDPLYYAPDIVRMIEDSSVAHEIAGHSFSHPRFSHLNRRQARQEIEAMVETFESAGIELDSMVHPGIDHDYLDLLSEFGISVISGGQSYENYTLRSGVHPFLNRDPSMVSAPAAEPYTTDDLIVVPRSRNLRDERWGWLNPHRVKTAIEDGSDGVLHLTFHPHNVIYDYFLQKTLPQVAKILDSYRNDGTVNIVTLSEFVEIGAQTSDLSTRD